MRNKKALTNLKRIGIVLAITVLLGAVITIKYFGFGKMGSTATPEYVQISPSSETCIQCHSIPSGFSEYHNPEAIGCISCHLGNGQVLEKEKSHEGMVLIPGNLSNATETCGKCHPNELSKIEASLMTTNSGIVAVDKFIFGEAETPNDHYHIQEIKHSASEKHLRDLCANCHLGAEKTTLGEITPLSRGGGCIACHLNYGEEAHTDLKNYMQTNKESLPKVHPSTDIFMNDQHCFGCHSRSSRISTNYEGWQETLLEGEEVKDNPDYRILEDLRVYTKKEADVHHANSMLCIDCHSSHEVMGNGKSYTHEEQAVTLQCSDCHYKENPKTIPYDSLDQESLLVFMHRKYTHNDKPILIAQEDGHPLVNTFLEGDQAYLIGKKDGRLHTINPQSKSCSRDNAHKNVSCATCHSSWTNKCIGCHNVYDKDDPNGYDLLDKKDVTGQWVEHVAEFLTAYPSLGVRETSHGKIYEPAIPGMIMTIDKGSFEKGRKGEDISFHRLYAPNAPHTTTKAVRDCKSCHSSPEALGYGNGKLTYETRTGSGVWQFDPEYAKNPNDGLPEDAWVGFMNEGNQNKINTTRTDFRPLSIKEQQRVLLVGACLQCHSGTSEVMQRSLDNFQSLLQNLDPQCILPNNP
ncbi:hypothetical protein [Maribacter polysaccharolyticus]|uniref:hypothetical protein n=1 Tax=Maribacter polysaccharolyticus TaxID=3020831 RepID=UPI00237F34C5|nr:hypothetical protein [Maribacter polysaccharolyticus]MDE3740462.1 hypothetical protein [Maribacter polysaccharolyticus]